MRFIEVVKSLDWILLASVLLLVMIGFAMLLSATYTRELVSPLFIRQALAAGLGFVLLLVVARIPYHVWQRYAPVLYGVGLLSLVIVTVVGAVIRGTVSRLEFFGFQLQPSELMKVVLVLTLAWLLARYRRIRWKQVVISGLLVMVPAILVLREPDFGMAALMVLTWVGMILFLGLPWRIAFILGGMGLASSLAAWKWFLLDYQKSRILTFLDPTADPLAAGYNITQAIIALGSGRLVGRGLGHGPQSQLKFLPERHTDFILASIGEELGFVGVAVVILLYVVILWRLLVIARLTRDRFGQLLAAGAFLLMLVSFTVSVGMNMGMLPITGIPLPLVSYGGSSLLATFLLLGLVQSVRVYSRFMRQSPPEISGFN